MSKLFPYIFFCIFILIVGCVDEKPSHLGMWQGEQNGDIGFIKLDESGGAYILVKGDTLGGDGFEMEGNPVNLTYVIDDTNEKSHIDFILKLADGDIELLRIPGIFKFNSSGDMILCLNYNDSRRPTTFVKMDTVVLKKVQ